MVEEAEVSAAANGHGEDAADGYEYEKAVEEPVTPIVMKTSKPLTRVDKMRMLARSGLPK